jgi:hypothetical protein
MPTTPKSRFAVQQSTAGSWLIRDLRYPPDDTRHLVARVDEESPEEMVVTWYRDHPLPFRYVSIQAVMDDLACIESRTSRAARPQHIPHHPPPGRKLSAAG